MSRPILAVVLLALASCQQAAPAQNPSPAQNPLPAQTPSPSQAASRSCRMPVGIQNGIGGFVDYPGGGFTPDPASDLTHSSFRGSNGSSIGFGPAYDAAQARWLPVPRALLASDGRTYAYTELIFSATSVNGPNAPLGSRIHVVDIASSTDRVVLDSRILWSAIAYSGGSVYLIHACIECGSGDGGLWTVDASSGAVKQVAAADASTQYMWTMVGTAAAWATDPHGGLARLDLATGTVSVWSGVAGKMLRPIGLDSRGLPIAEGEANYSIAGSFRGGAWLVRGPQDAVQIAPDDLLIDDAVLDAHGVWLLSFNDIYLWNAGSGLDHVGAIPASTSAKSLAGPCLS